MCVCACVRACVRAFVRTCACVYVVNRQLQNSSWNNYPVTKSKTTMDLSSGITDNGVQKMVGVLT